MEENKEEKHWGLPHWIAFFSSLGLGASSGINVHKYYFADRPPEPVLTIEEKLTLLSDVRQIKHDMIDLKIDVESLRVTVKSARLDLNGHPGLVCSDSKIKLIHGG